MSAISDWITEFNKYAISSFAQPIKGSLALLTAAWQSVLAGPVGPAGGDLSGSYPNPLVTGFDGVAINNAGLADGDAYVYDSGSGKFVLYQVKNTTLGGDLSGTLPNPSVVGLRGRALDVTAPTGLQQLTFDAASGHWFARTGGLLATTTFAASGTWTPNALTTSALVYIWGAGGGGGGAAGLAVNCAAGGGGISGAFALKGISGANVVATAITIGAGGAAGDATGSSGGTGGASTFGALITCNGGPGGVGDASPSTTPHTTALPSGIPSATGGDYNAFGSRFGTASLVISGTVGMAGGGSAPVFGRAAAGNTLATGGTNGTAPGGAASGGLAIGATGHAGGIGGDGMCIVFEFL